VSRSPYLKQQQQQQQQQQEGVMAQFDSTVLVV
jgi:hypothetical protein